MSCDSNDDEFKLTKEYKYLLSNIRPLIDQLEKSRDAQLCLLWLSKLEQCGKWEKKYRNKILSELCKQVNENYLKPPFSAPPPSGPLQNVILGFCRVSEWKLNELSEDDSTEADLSSSSPNSKYSLKNLSNCPSSDSPSKGDCFYSNLRNKLSTKLDRDEIDHSECFAIQKAYHERAQNDQLVIEKYQSIIKSMVTQKLKADVTPNKIKKLQSTYENKVTELVHSLKKCQNENDLLKREVESATRDLKKLEFLKTENESLKEQVANLTAEKNSLDIKYKKSEEEKLMAFTDLRSKLNESEKRLKESENRYNSLQRKYEETSHNCNTEHLAQKSEIEKKYAADLSTLEKLLEQKNCEINELKEQISNQCTQFGEEISKLKQEFSENASLDRDKRKIKILKSKARKLEKMREHMAVLFHSELQQIIAKKDFYIATLEMQLKMYTSDLGNNNLGSDIHNALLHKVSTLEAQYRKLLEDSEKQSIMRRQLDLQKIHNLEKQLLLCGGVIEDEESTLNCLKTKSLISVTAIDEEHKADSLP